MAACACAPPMLRRGPVDLEVDLERAEQSAVLAEARHPHRQLCWHSGREGNVLLAQALLTAALREEKR